MTCPIIRCPRPVVATGFIFYGFLAYPSPNYGRRRTRTRSGTSTSDLYNYVPWLFFHFFFLIFLSQGTHWGPCQGPNNMCTLNHGKFHPITVIKRKASTIQKFVCGLMVTRRNAVQIFEAKLPH